MPKWLSGSSEEVTLEAYSARLRVFYDEKGIGVRGFDCPRASECVAAADPRPLHHGAEAHVGSRYGEVFRVVVASLDTGHAPANLIERREIIESLGRKGLNPHMRGTTELLLLFLEGEIPVGASPHPYYAMINVAKCSGADGKRNMVPARLYDNCRAFALEELSILQPQLVVTQGKEAAGALGDLFELPGSSLKDVTRGLHALGEVEGWLASLAKEYLSVATLPDGSSIPVLRTPHPAARNGSWQLFKRIALRPVVSMIGHLRLSGS